MKNYFADSIAQALDSKLDIAMLTIGYLLVRTKTYIKSASC